MADLFENIEESYCSSTDDHMYDVFLSFRGVDTRYGFTDHLHKALVDANISTFLDDEDIETGGDLKPELESAIKASKASIIVLSKNYANSSWCLDELVLILEQRMTSNHIVIPIFYHVEPTHVRKQQNTFGDAMAKHKQTMKAETNAYRRSQWAKKMDSWNKALTEVADLKGGIVNGRRETELIEKVVKDIYRILHISSRSVLPQLFGMHYSIKRITSWLKDASSDKADVLAICGMGGIGKTSLAKYVYKLNSHKFDTHSFIEDIGRKCVESFNGLLDLQKQLNDDILKRTSVQVHDVSIYTSKIESIVNRKKVLLVLDDIDSLNQLDALLRSKGFHPGSKIIITTKDAWLTESCALFKINVKPNYTKHVLQGLHETESRKLLCFHAFMCNYPTTGYEEVVEKIIKYCEGHPMALKLLGKSLHNRDVAYWEGRMEGLIKDNGSPINTVFRLSFDSLPSKDDKDLFKHIACFFVGMDRDVTETILKACDIETRSGITNLLDKYLLGIGWNNKLTMHQLVQEMGRFIVREESPEKPWERSRLWSHESFKVLKQNKGTENVLGLTLDMRMLEKEILRGSIQLNTDALSKMKNLMLLQLNDVQISGSYKMFPQELRWLCMHQFPLKSIPSDLPVEFLVSLDISYSNIQSFGIFYSNPQLRSRKRHLTGSCLKEKRLFGSLKILNLSYCEQLCSLGGFDDLPVLERLIVTHCINLVKVCESIEQCVELVFVDMSYCKNLEKGINIFKLEKVKTLMLDGCNLGGSRTEIRDVGSPKRLKANNIGINRETSSSTVLEAIPSHSKFFMISLPKSLVSLSLQNNILSTESFPMDFSCLSMLKELYLDNNPIVSMPSCVRSLCRLRTLSMMDCRMLMSVEYPPRTLRKLLMRSNHKALLQKVVFDPEMSLLSLTVPATALGDSSLEFEGLFKIQPMASVEEKVIRRLGWTDLDFHSKRGIESDSFDTESEGSQIQMYFEFGIFSIVYWGKEMPDWITHISEGPFISLTIPFSPYKLKGLNLCCVQTSPFLNEEIRLLPMIIITNITTNQTWIYDHFFDKVHARGREYCFLSHWMFGMNEMQGGDQVTIAVKQRYHNRRPQITEECGLSLVYDDGKRDEEEEEDALGYYKSWNHIIGGDLSYFQTTTGENILSKRRVTLPGLSAQIYYGEVLGRGSQFIEKYIQFRALYQRKSDILMESPDYYYHNYSVTPKPFSHHVNKMQGWFRGSIFANAVSNVNVSVLILVGIGLLLHHLRKLYWPIGSMGNAG